jgi:hypothetical protein
MKNATDDQKRKLIWVSLGEYYQRPLTENQIRMYAEDTAAYPVEALIHAAKIWRDNPDNNRCPIPANLIQIINPTPSAQGEAVEVMNRIWEAIGKFGWPNPDGAKEFIGELGWTVVQRYGGWAALCNEANSSEAGIMKAQLRESVKSVSERSKAGVLHIPPALPKPDGEFKSLGEILALAKLKGNQP